MALKRCAGVRCRPGMHFMEHAAAAQHHAQLLATRQQHPVSEYQTQEHSEERAVWAPAGSASRLPLGPLPGAHSHATPFSETCAHPLPRLLIGTPSCISAPEDTP